MVRFVNKTLLNITIHQFNEMKEVEEIDFIDGKTGLNIELLADFKRKF